MHTIPSPTQSPHQDIIVIGSGIVGLCIALSLQKSGRKVLLVGDNKKPIPASYGNAGHIACEQIRPLASLGLLKSLPAMLVNPLGPIFIDLKKISTLVPWFAKFLLSLRHKPYNKSCLALQTINQLALPAWQQLLKEESLSYLLKINGSYLIAEKKKSLNLLFKDIELFNKLGVVTEAITQQKLHQTIPLLNKNQLGGLFFPETAHTICPELLCQSIKKRFLIYGGKLLNDEVISVKNKDSSVEINYLQSNQMTSSQAIIACGIYSKNLVSEAAKTTPPLQAERGYHLMAYPPENMIDAPVTSVDRRFIMTPMETGLRLAGVVEYTTSETKPNYQKAHNLCTLANGILNSPLKIQPKSEWAGCRPTLPDSLPVIDKINNIGYAFGHQHLGLTQAAITAKWITSFMNSQKTNIDLSAYQLNRFHT